MAITQKMLTNEQWGELYTSSIENRKDIVWIRKGMDRHTTEIEDCRNRVNILEVDQGIKKGKIAFLAITITGIFTVLSNAVFWTLTHIGGSK